MKYVSNFPHDVIEHEDMPIFMSDGCRISARVWMPKDADKKPAPVILEHLPYRKRDGTIVRDEYTHPWFAGHGYVCIRTDMRGNGDSEGLMDDEYTEQELQDAVEVINWAAKQPWCNGNIGMMGISWGGFNGLQVAALAPTPLKAVITLCSTVDRYADDIHYKGGCLLGENFGWASNMLSYSSRPPDPKLVGDRWLDMWRHRLENLDFSMSTWLHHQHRNDYWKHGSVCEDYSTIKAAVLSIGGWHDGYRNTISHLVENLSAPVKGIVGPWIHKYPHFAGPQPAIGFLQEAKRWWDHWLKGLDTGVETDPDYRAYLMDSITPKRWLPERPGHWIAEQEWPSKNITTQQFYFGTGNLLSEGPQQCNLDISSRMDCGKNAGEYFPFAFSDELPDRQNDDDDASICFDSSHLSDAIDIVGSPKATIKLSCNKPVGQIVVRLCDLRPDGSSALITYGFLNLCHRNSHEHPMEIPTNESFQVCFNLDQIAYRIPAGHKLRVAISNAYWPSIWPSSIRSTLTIHSGKIDLPARQASSDIDEVSFEQPEAAPEWQAKILRKTSYNRNIKNDDRTGVTTTDIFCDFGENQDLAHGLISGGWVKELWSIKADDPLSAKAQSEWEKTGGRQGQMWKTHVTTNMSCDETHFYYHATLTAYLNGEQIFTRDYEGTSPRDLV